MSAPVNVSTPVELLKLPVMLFWLLKINRSPVCSVPAEIVTRGADQGGARWNSRSRPSRPPRPCRRSSSVLVVPDGMTTGAMLTVSDTVLLASKLSPATIESERGVMLVLVEENVTDCKAAL